MASLFVYSKEAILHQKEVARVSLNHRSNGALIIIIIVGGGFATEAKEKQVSGRVFEEKGESDGESEKNEKGSG